MSRQVLVDIGDPTRKRVVLVESVEIVPPTKRVRRAARIEAGGTGKARGRFRSTATTREEEVEASIQTRAVQAAVRSVRSQCGLSLVPAEVADALLSRRIGFRTFSCS
jgi:hypothetical protein